MRDLPIHRNLERRWIRPGVPPTRPSTIVTAPLPGLSIADAPAGNNRPKSAIEINDRFMMPPIHRRLE
jgi:hypothetical protein